ncbi:MAG: DeoR/GlpR transcriptional regulator, partial [Alphaproteobacteria bacterium]|nr:DeoR/GlpR transcriptional regulator [Alphaproteobacteria bacterium]
KRAIGRAAAALVPDGATVAIDSGTTTRCVAEALRAKRGLTVYTNAIEVARLLGRHAGNRVVLLGGDWQDHEDSTSSLDTVAALARYRPDFAFVGAGGIAADGQLTDFTRVGAELRTLMMRRARRALVVADRTKFGRATLVTVEGFARPVELICDRAPPPELRRALAARGVKAIVAGRS